MKDLFTIVYYTSNRESEAFENKIREKLIENCSGVPIISVSQKPINLGKNICVGDVGISNQNVFRQLQIGAKAATTPFIISAEADCLYPPDYFQYEPPEVNECWRNTNVWILGIGGGGYNRKRYSEFSQICGREYLIESIDYYLGGKGTWNPALEHGSQARSLFGKRRWKFFELKNPAISIKTYNGMHLKTRTMSKTGVPVLPFWGPADELRKELFK
jgi:hypothetical protein